MAAPRISIAVGKVQTFLLNFQTVDATNDEPNIGRFRLPQKARIMRIGCAARDWSAGLAAYSLMIEADGVDLLDAAIDIIGAGKATYAEGVLVNAAGDLAPEGVLLAQEAEITVDVAAHSAGGESASETTVQVDYLPED